MGTSLVVQWLRLHAPSASDSGLISGQGTRSHMLQLKKKRIENHYAPYPQILSIKSNRQNENWFEIDQASNYVKKKLRHSCWSVISGEEKTIFCLKFHYAPPTWIGPSGNIF